MWYYQLTVLSHLQCLELPSSKNIYYVLYKVLYDYSGGAKIVASIRKEWRLVLFLQDFIYSVISIHSGVAPNMLQKSGKVTERPSSWPKAFPVLQFMQLNGTLKKWNICTSDGFWYYLLHI